MDRCRLGFNTAVESRIAIEKWIDTVLVPLLPKLPENMKYNIPITWEKDYQMEELWDDRCVQVIPNTGIRADGKE